MIFKRFYNGGSASDRTSLFALRNLVNWRDVVTDSHCRPAQCKRFISLVLDADIVAAAFHFFGMESLEDAPSKHGFSGTMASRVAVVKQRYLSSTVREFLNQYVLEKRLYSAHLQNINSLDEWEAAVNGQILTADDRYPCRYAGCHHTFKHDGVCRRRHEMSHDPPPDVINEPVLVDTVPDNSKDPKVKNDEYDYHCCFMNMALLLRNFADAGREGDGERLVRCIKFFMLHFFQDGSGSTKYCLEALYQMFQINALLTPREAQRMVWNRTVNNKGGLGNNVFMDLDLEHDNHGLKDIKGVLGANISEASVTRICRAFFQMKTLAKTFDQEIGVKQVFGDHTRKDVTQDLHKIVRVLKEEKVFTNSAVRKTMRGFPNCPRDYLQLLNTGALFKWINDHKRKVSQGLRPR